MNKESISYKNNSRGIITLFAGIIFQAILFVVGNLLDAVYSIDSPVLVLFLSGIIIEFGLFSWFVVRVILNGILLSGISGSRTGLEKKKIENEKVSVCSVNNSMLCPLNVGFNEYGFTLKINDSTSLKDRLFEKEYVYETEKNGNRGKAWKEIWIFSENLLSEIDVANNRAEPVLVTNITSNRTKYTIFYLSIEDQTDEIETRKNQLRDSLSARDKKSLLSFVPIDVKRGYLGRNTLPLLCGSILFCQNHQNNKNPMFTEGYLSIRMNNEDTPIYYSMPRCMLKKYADYFQNIKQINGGAS